MGLSSVDIGASKEGAQHRFSRNFPLEGGKCALPSNQELHLQCVIWVLRMHLCAYCPIPKTYPSHHAGSKAELGSINNMF